LRNVENIIYNTAGTERSERKDKTFSRSYNYCSV